MSNKIRPLSNRVVVEPIAIETTTAAGIIIPDTASKEKPIEGTVIAVGSGHFIEGKFQPLDVKVGDKVLFHKHGGNNITLDSQKYLVMYEEDILAILED